VTSFLEFRNVTNILPEADVLDIIWEDGQKLDITVKATDILSEFTVDTVTIYKDFTTPKIEDLWLSKGDKVSLFVHHIEDFTAMT
jgi:hypothetical protein